MRFLLLVLCVLLLACTQESAQELEQGLAAEQDLSEENVEPSLQQQIQEMYQEYKAAGFAQVPDCSAMDLQKMQTAHAVILIDVRSDEERAVSTIPGAISMETFHAKEWPAGKTIVVYCTIGVRSAMACMSLKSQGIPAINLAGGILHWTAQELPLVHAGQETKRLHTYGQRWALVPENVEAVY